MENLKVLKKIFEARKEIKKSDLKKLGRNDYSKYDYYTPEQVDLLVHSACEKLQLLNIFELKRTELGLLAQITVIDLESGESRIFESATEMPEIKATNVAQQMGGCMTYSERYLLMFIYSIKDNNLDFDTPKKETKQSEQKGDIKWLSESGFNKIKEQIIQGNLIEAKEAINIYSSNTHKMKKQYKDELNNLINKTETGEIKTDLPF